MNKVTPKTLALVLAGLLATGATTVSAHCRTERPAHNYPSHMETTDCCMPYKVVPPCSHRDSYPYIDEKEYYQFHGRGYRRGHSCLSFEDRQILLAGKLNLSETQKPYWDAYTKALEVFHHISPMKLSAQMTQQDRLEHRVKRLKERLERTEELVKTRSELLKQLTPKQVEVFESFEHCGARKYYPASYNRDCKSVCVNF